jgi:hypothetical protein
LTQQNKSVSKENISKNQETIENNTPQTELNKEPNMTKENNQKLLNIINPFFNKTSFLITQSQPPMKRANNKNHITELGQKYLKTLRRVKNNKENFANIKTSKKINLNSNVMKERMNKNQSSLLKNNFNTDSKVKIETSILIPNNEISSIDKEKIKDNCESKNIQKFEIFTPIKVNQVKDKFLKSFKLKQIKSTISFNNVKKCNNNSRNSKNEKSLSRSSKKIVVMKIIRTNSIINNSSYLNTENRFSVTRNSAKLNRNSEDFDNDTQTKFFTTSQIYLNKNYISTSKLDMPKNKSNEENIAEKNRITKNNRIERKKGFALQEISPYSNK